MSLVLVAFGITIKALELWFWLVVIIYLAAGDVGTLAGTSALHFYRYLRWRIELAWLDFLVALLGFRDILERHRTFHILDPVFVRLY